jgi:hypothetical protein
MTFPKSNINEALNEDLKNSSVDEALNAEKNTAALSDERFILIKTRNDDRFNPNPCGWGVYGFRNFEQV